MSSPPHHVNGATTTMARGDNNNNNNSISNGHHASTVRMANKKPSSPSSLSDDTSDDDEIKAAKAMALAIKNNPNMTVEQIRQLMANGSGSAQQQQQPSQSQHRPLIGGRLVNMFSTASNETTTGATASAMMSTSLDDNQNSNNKNKIGGGRFLDSLRGTVRASANAAGVGAVGGALSLVGVSNGTGSSSSSTNTNRGGGMKMIEHQQQQQQQMAITGTESTSTAAAAVGGPSAIMPVPSQQQQQQHLSQPSSPTTTTNTGQRVSPTSSPSSGRNSKTHRRVSSQKQQQMERDGIAQQSTALVMSTSGHSAIGGVPASASRDGSASGSGLRLPFRMASSKNLVRSPPITPSGSDDGTAFSAIEQGSGAGAVAAAAHHHHPSSSSTYGTTAVVPAVAKLSSTAGTHGGAYCARLSGVCWKRRGGMGKFSVTSAWEKRRVELQGTKLMYFLHDDDDHDDDATGIGTQYGGGGGTSDDDNDDHLHGSGNNTDGVVVNKRTTWFESTFVANHNSGTHNNNANVNNDDPGSPRGYIDLARESVSVAASYGHSGAPSPFAISLKVKNETKWKLCYDTHKQQMEWLVAITDVIIQCSVDVYNTALLQLTDPTPQQYNITGTASDGATGGASIFQSQPQVSEPPPTMGGGGGHRLWMLDEYILTSSKYQQQQALALQQSSASSIPFQDLLVNNNSATATGNGSSKPVDLDDPVDGLEAQQRQLLPDQEQEQKLNEESIRHLNDNDDHDDDDDDDNGVTMMTLANLVMSPSLSSVAAATTSSSPSSSLSSSSTSTTATWLIPEKNLYNAAIIFNVAVIIARSSTITMDGFWYLIVFANFTMFYLCFVKEQYDWKKLAESIVIPVMMNNNGRDSGKRTRTRTRGMTTSTTKVVSSSSTTKSVGGPSSSVATTVTATGKKVTAAAGKEGSTSSTAVSLNLRAGDETTPKKATTKTGGYIPVAGCSSVKLKETTDTPCNSKGEMFAGWRTPPGDTMMVRSHGYLSTKKKIASPGELFDCTAMDVFESPQRYPGMAPRVQLPTVNFDDVDNGRPKTWRTPDVFIISIALPTDPPKLGRSSSDGGGYTITMYYTMKKETREILRRITADDYDPTCDEAVIGKSGSGGGDDEDDPIQKSQVNAVRLLEEWCRRAPNDPKFQSRFKVVPNAHNLKEIGMPSWISAYNGKPFLIKRPGETGFLLNYPELSCMEFDISLHPFPYLAKQAICFMKDTFFKKTLVSFGFVIEGRADDELPECLIGLMQMCYPDPIYAIQAKDFFAGTSPRSF